jgi:hypothetical protein
LAWKTSEFRALPEFGPRGGVQSQCNTTNIYLKVNNTWTYELHRLDVDLCSSSPQVQAKIMDNICNMICQRIHEFGSDSVIAHPHHY